MANVKAVVDLSVIPKNMTLDQFNNIIEKTGLIVVDTQHYFNDDLGVQIVDENLEIITIDEYNERTRMEERSIPDLDEEE